jgi:hypothetical protein
MCGRLPCACAAVLNQKYRTEFPKYTYTEYAPKPDNDYLAGELYRQDQTIDAARAAIKEILRHRKPSRKMLQRALRILEGKPDK